MVPSVSWYVVDEPVVCYSSFHMLECPGSKIFKASEIIKGNLVTDRQWWP